MHALIADVFPYASSTDWLVPNFIFYLKDDKISYVHLKKSGELKCAIIEQII